MHYGLHTRMHYGLWEKDSDVFRGCRLHGKSMMKIPCSVGIFNDCHRFHPPVERMQFLIFINIIIVIFPVFYFVDKEYHPPHIYVYMLIYFRPTIHKLDKPGSSTFLSND
jgi:hypothetical protein